MMYFKLTNFANVINCITRDSFATMNLPQPVNLSMCYLIIFVLFPFCLGSFTALNAQPQSITFDCLTLDQGLSQSTVASIVQDKDGYMWFGTIDGLNKFDGYTVTVYQNVPGDSTSIADNWITSLCLGTDAILWIGTLSRGLCKFDSKTGHFTNYQFNPIPVDSSLRESLLKELPFTFSYFNYYTIKSVYEDSFGSLWIGTFGSGLYKFDKEKNEFARYPFNLKGNHDLAYNIMSITETIQDGISALWLGTYGGGLVKFVESEGFSCYKHDPENQNSLSNNQIISVYPDTSGGKNTIWIGTFGGGLDKFDLNKEEFTHYRYDPHNPHSLSSDYVLSVLKDCCNELWIGTFNGGLNRFDINENRFIRYQHDATNVNSLGSNEVLSLYEDNSGILWIGTNFGYGINKFNRRKNKFIHYFHDLSDENSLSENVVFSIFEDRDGILWIGTFQTGLNRFDREKGIIQNYRHNSEDPNSLSDNHIRSIFEDSQGRLWIGTFSGGLNYFDRVNNKFIHYKHHPSDSNSLSADQIRSIFEDQSGNLWIAAFGGGLDKFNPDTGEFTHYRYDPDNPNSVSDNQVYFITGDKSSMLWIGTFGGGINAFNPKNETFTRIRHDPEQDNSLIDDRILTIYLDERDSNIVWIGTFGSGLDKLILGPDSIGSRFDKNKQTFIHYTLKNGLPNEVVYGILPDEEGNLWLSTNKGLSKFNPQNETFINYDLLDGLQSNEFNAGAYYRNCRTGEMFFGGVNGLNCFFPDKIETNQNVPQVVITSFKVFDEEIADQIGPIFKGKEIELSHRENFFSFEFSVLDYTDVTKNQFAYKLAGLDEDWIDCGTRKYVNYTNLDPGNYVFRVKGSNCDGVWNEQGTYVKLRIKPRFYQTWWWHPMVVGLLILMIIILFTWRTRYNIKRSLELERIRNQEKELVQKTIAADFHDELGQKLTKISLFSEIMKKNLSDTSTENLEYISKISSSAKELSSSTRDFIWTLSPEQDSLHDVVIYLKDFGDELFDKTGVDFRVNGISRHLEKIRLPMEWRRHLILIFKEAMNNVIKHAGCSNLTLKILVNHNTLEMTLSDDGLGCFNGKLPGCQGLNNMKNRAKTIQGILNVIFNEGKGTTIQFVGEIPRMGY